MCLNAASTIEQKELGNVRVCRFAGLSCQLGNEENNFGFFNSGDVANAVRHFSACQPV